MTIIRWAEVSDSQWVNADREDWILSYVEATPKRRWGYCCTG